MKLGWDVIQSGPGVLGSADSAEEDMYKSLRVQELEWSKLDGETLPAEGREARRNQRKS